MYYRIFNIPVMRWIFRTSKAIPIAGVRENRALMERAFDEIDAALADGGIVGIFPEGRLTTDGEIAAFKSGVERILARAADAGRPVPVVRSEERRCGKEVVSTCRSRWWTVN